MRSEMVICGDPNQTICQSACIGLNDAVANWTAPKIAYRFPPPTSSDTVVGRSSKH